MHIDFDVAKNERNVRERGLPFALAESFDFETALIWQDTRKEYPETRWVALGRIHDRVYALVFSETPVGIRIISLRKANRREVARYEQETQS
ncbi:hypothetical protein CK623_13260 [Vandammella animalimorsus]|uniref:BrnT family toxin n=1 Tax=Vandammella animalimorsus TaxID=2029117 RepID=A0A2A2AHA7_9BURK|nr:BrnT family toxin [Vandammella animalimorsus]PAT37945.1 hypothetical protein CK623_13260 [Vandammella animalimorsus]